MGMYLIYRLYHARNIRLARLTASQRRSEQDRTRQKLKNLLSLRRADSQESGSLDEQEQDNQGRGDAKLKLSSMVASLHSVGAEQASNDYEAKYDFNVNKIFEMEEGVSEDFMKDKTPNIATGGNVDEIAEQMKLKKLNALKAK
jgi:hypothetical protein